MFGWPFGKKPVWAKREADLPEMDAPLARHVSSILTGAGVPTLRQALPALTAELERARRYDRPLVVVLVTDDRSLSSRGAPRLDDGRHTETRRALPPGSPLVTAMIASVVREIVREADLVAFAAALGQCVVLMPEITGDDASRAWHRVGALCASRLSFPICVGLATFPRDGWTLQDLIRHAQGASVAPATAAETLSMEPAARAAV